LKLGIVQILTTALGCFIVQKMGFIE